MFKRIKYILIFITIFVWFSSPLAGADIQLSATVDRITVAINQTFSYTLEISGEKAQSVQDPKLPDINEFATFLGSSGTSSNIQIINGKMSVSKSMSYTFMATKIGKFQIPPAEIELGGKTYTSESMNIEIVAQAAPPQTAPQRRREPHSTREQSAIEGNLFLRAFANKKSVYVNEPVILTYKIYTAVTVTSYGISKTPNTTGFWAEEFPMDNQPRTYRDMYQGREFLVAEIKKLSLFPTDPGEKTIEPMQIECDVRVQAQRRSIFDSFFDDPFFGKTVRQTVYSPPITINVMPLPQEGKPSDFSGLVGNFSISATVDKIQVHTNEAIALKVKITGTGNIKVIPMPKVEIPPDFEQYEPKVTEDINRSGNTISGGKTYEYVLIPRFPGIQRISPIQFTYFDLNSKTYKRISTPEIEINVEKGSDELMIAGSGLSKEEVKLLGKDIRFIQKHQPEFKKVGQYWYNSPFFMVLIIFPLLFVGGSVVYRHHLDKISGDIAYARSRKANQMAMNRLKKARRVLSANTQKEFYAESAKALLGFLADKLNISAAGIITDQVEEMMKSRHINASVISQYLHCLQTCDYQRFAPSDSTLNEMKQFYERAKTAIVSLEKMI